MIDTLEMDLESVSCPIDKYTSHIQLFQHLSRPCDWVFLGDSITNAGRWSELFPTLTVNNQGIDGDTSKGVFARVRLATNLKPKVVFVMCGINDIIQERSEAVIMQNYRQLIDKIHAAGARVVVQSTLLTSDDSWNMAVNSLNDRLSALAQQLNAPFLDLNHAFGFEERIADQATFDGVHLQADMYIKWSKAISSLAL